jgi:hypothetical protein
MHQAERWADAIAHPFGGRLHVVEPLALEAPWPDAAASVTPIGHVPSPTTVGAIVPVCPAGLSMLMAPLVLAGGPRAGFLIIPVFAVLLVLATYAAGARYGTPVGVAAAVVTAASPIFLYQSVQPMSDVPAAALWMTAVACALGGRRRDVVLAGVAASLAILVRPNLVPLGAGIGLFMLCRPERTPQQRLRNGGIFAAWLVPGCLGVGLVQWALYGSPLSSGYGSFSDLFAFANVVPNLERYLTWLWQTHTPLLVLAAAAPLLLPGAPSALMLGLFLVNLMLYLPYTVFEDWSFLRFLLPTLPLLVILAIAAIDAAWRRMTERLRARSESTPSGRGWLLAGVAIAWAALMIGEARDRSTFRLRSMEARFERAGLFVGERLPANAIVLASWESGSVRFYSGRKTLAWHSLDPAWLDRGLDYLRSRGYEPFLLMERWEEPAFRDRFKSSALGALDWPPAYEVASQVRIYRPDDRQRFLNRTSAPTVYAR